MQSGHRSPGHITMNIIIDIYVFTFPPSNLTLLQWDPSSSSSSSSNPNFMFLHNLSNVCWHLSPVIANSNHLGWCACIFSSCCQSNPQRIRCQWNTHSKSITCTINYGCTHSGITGSSWVIPSFAFNDYNNWCTTCFYFFFDFFAGPSGHVLPLDTAGVLGPPTMAKGDLRRGPNVCRAWL